MRTEFWSDSRPRRFRPVEAAGELSHVMADFVGDRHTPRRNRRRTEARLRLAQEREIDVELLVIRAVERAHRGLSIPHAAHLPVVEVEDGARYLRFDCCKYSAQTVSVLPRTFETNCPVSYTGAPLGASRVSARCSLTC